jgi:hypothetical protein
MNMLQAGGMVLLTDGVRVPDENNPRGYFEFEAVKELDKSSGDLAWLPLARGKAVKIISLLLTWLPESYDYRVILMQRDLGEIMASQNKLLAAHGEVSPEQGGLDRGDHAGSNPGTDADGIRRVYEQHLRQVDRFLDSRNCFRSLRVSYRDVVEHPDREARRVSALVDQRLDVGRMTAVVDCELYRNRA